MLATWVAPTLGLYQMRLEIATQTSPSGQTPVTYKNEGHTDWYSVNVNYRYPTNPMGPVGTFIFTNEPVCATFPAGTHPTGTMSAQSPFFGYYEVNVINSNIPVEVDGKTTLNPGYTAISNVPWSWNSAGVPPCGYAVEMTVCDRTIYNSAPGDPDCWGSSWFGFCVGPALGTSLFEEDFLISEMH